jgi:transposase
MSLKGKTLVGLDVHAAQTHAAVLDVESGELSVQKLWGAAEEVLSFLEGLGPRVRGVYEAGPTGFGLARAARERGIDLGVVAPGSIPKASGDRVKTDRRDAARLARLLAAGELRFAFVPSVAEEQFRDLTRAIEAVRGDLMRARHRLSKFLLRRGVRFPGPGGAWTLAHLRWLRGLSFDDACSQASFVDYLAAVELLLARRASLLEALERAVPTSSQAELIAGCVASEGSTRCRPPGSPPRSATSRASPSRRCSRDSSASSRPSTPPISGAGKARSPRPGRHTRADCWSKPLTTTAPIRRSAKRSPAGKPARTPG